MQVLILGAGIIGLNTAYTLMQQGYQVTVLDVKDEVGQGASFANGAQLSYSYVAPLAGPGVLGKVPKWLLDPNSPLRFRPSLKPADACWNLQFMKACNTKRSDQTTAELLKLAYLSRDLYHQLFTQEKLEVDFSSTGKLVVHRSQASMDSAVKQLEVQRRLGAAEQFALNTQECLEQEPALAQVASQIVGGIYTPSEEAADSYKVCLDLKAILEAGGVQFLFKKGVRKIERQADNRVSVRLHNNETLSAEHIVVCLGVESTALLADAGISVPVAPLKGYSLSLDITDPTQAPNVSITDFERKVVYARIGTRLRVAGMADLVGIDYRIDPQRIRALIQEAQGLFAQAGDYEKATQWAGLRPATPLGKPIIDKTPYRNLYLNIGHGALGLTLATGSAHMLADLIAGKSHELSGLFNQQAAKA